MGDILTSISPPQMCKRISFYGCTRVKLEGLGHDHPIVVFKLLFCFNNNNNNNNNNLSIHIAQASWIYDSQNITIS